MIKERVIKLIRYYQREISTRRPARCRYYPTCSEYGVQAIEEHGLIKGLLLTGCRIIRCNRLFRGGYDPVPERKGK